MKYFQKNKDIIIKDSDFDLNNTFNCGQCFRWERDRENKNIFIGIVYNKKIKILKEKENIILKNISLQEFENIWKSYFDLNLDYIKIKKDLSLLNPVLKEAISSVPGIRILRQDPFEALCSFIISQNNNIPRIKLIIKRLCENFGDKIDDDSYAFPDLKKLKNLNEDDLSVLKAGFRSSYLLDAFKKLSSGEIDLEKIKNMEIQEARRELMKIKGVGPKVAECTLLYGLHKLEAFPIDVWMKRAIEEFFPDYKEGCFGEYAGIAQQYIFHFVRLRDKNSKRSF